MASYSQRTAFDEQPRMDRVNKGQTNNEHTHKQYGEHGETSNGGSDADDHKFDVNPRNLHRLSTMSSTTSNPSPTGERCPLKSFPWLDDVIQNSLRCLGDIPDPSSEKVFDCIDYLLGNFVEDYNEYYKCPKLASILSKYVRNFLYMYRFMYMGYDKGNRYFNRITKLLAMYIDLELCASTLGFERDRDIANRILLTLRTYLETAEEFTFLDVFVKMNRLRRGHRSILNLFLRKYLVDTSILDPIEVEDDVYIKYLIVFRKWLLIDDIEENQRDIRNHFVAQFKPKKTICTNTIFMPHLPCDTQDYVMTDRHELLLESQLLLQPLIHLFNMQILNAESTVKSSKLPKNVREIVILEDDETDPNKFTIKTEANDSNMIDLTDDLPEEFTLNQHKLSWLSKMVASASVMLPIDDSEDEDNEQRIKAETENTKAKESVHSNAANLERAEVLLSECAEAQNELNERTKRVTEVKNGYLSANALDNEEGRTQAIEIKSEAPVIVSSDVPVETFVSAESAMPSESIFSERIGLDRETAKPLTCVASIDSEFSKLMDNLCQPIETIKPLSPVEPMETITPSTSLPPIEPVPSLPIFPGGSHPTNEKHIQSAETYGTNNQSHEYPYPSTTVAIEPITSSEPLLSAYIRGSQKISSKTTKRGKRKAKTGESKEPIGPVAECQDRIGANVAVTISSCSADISSIVATHNEPSLTEHNRSTNNTEEKTLYIKPFTELMEVCENQIEPQPQILQNLSNEIHSEENVEQSELLDAIHHKSHETSHHAPDTDSNSKAIKTRKAGKILASDNVQNDDEQSDVLKQDKQKDGDQPARGRSSLRLAQKSKQNKTDAEDNSEKSAPSTIMERKTYIKSTSTSATKGSVEKNHSSRYLNRVSARTPPPTVHTQPVPIVTTQPINNQLNSTPQEAMLEPKQPKLETHKLSGTGIDIKYSSGLDGMQMPLIGDMPSFSHTLKTYTDPFCETQYNVLNEAKKHFEMFAMPDEKLFQNSDANLFAVKYQLLPSIEQYKSELTSSDSYPSLALSSSMSSAYPYMAKLESSAVASPNDLLGGMKFSSNDVKFSPTDMKVEKSEMKFSPKEEPMESRSNTPLLPVKRQVIDESDYSSNTYSPDGLTDENDECEAALPFKKRRKLAAVLDDAAASSAAATPTPPLPVEPPLQMPEQPPKTEPQTQPKRLSYPSTRMLSIANVVEFLPVRAYQTLKTPAPEYSSGTFELLPQETTMLLGAPQNIDVTQLGAMPANASRQSMPLNMPPTSDPFLHTLNMTTMQMASANNATKAFSVATSNGYNYYQTYPTHSPFSAAYNLQSNLATTNNIPSPNTLNTLNVHNFSETANYAAHFVQTNHTAPTNLPSKQAFVVDNSLGTNKNASATRNAQQSVQQAANLRVPPTRSQTRAQTRSQPRTRRSRTANQNDHGHVPNKTNCIDPTGSVVTKGARKMLVTPDQKSSKSSSAML